MPLLESDFPDTRLDHLIAVVETANLVFDLQVEGVLRSERRNHLRAAGGKCCISQVHDPREVDCRGVSRRVLCCGLAGVNRYSPINRFDSRERVALICHFIRAEPHVEHLPFGVFTGQKENRIAGLALRR